MPSNFDPKDFLMWMAALVVCVTIHEFAHAYSAWKAGDDTPRLQGRISLNPIDHLDLLGTIMMVVTSITGMGIGWGKAVMVNPYNFRHPRWDNLKVSLWGPLSNLLTAVVVGLALRFTAHSMNYNAFLFLFTLTTAGLVLAFFNLLPIAPLDGSHILSALLPHESARRYDYFMARYGFLILLVIVVAVPGVLGRILGPPIGSLLRLLVG